MPEKIGGSCLCGKVSFEITNDFQRFFMCHCEQCQKISGSDHVSNLFAEPDSLTWLAGKEAIKRFDYPGRGFTNAFCSDCGSGVPYLNQRGTAVVVRAGSLNGAPATRPARKIFCCERTRWSEDSANAETFDKFPA